MRYSKIYHVSTNEILNSLLNQIRRVLRLTSFVGNIAYPQVLVTCEITIALFSSCLPNIFSFSKYAARKHLSGLLGKSNASTPSSGPEGSHIGPIGKTVDEWRNNGFVPLQSDKGGSEAS